MKKFTDYQKISQIIEAKGISIPKAEVLSGLGATTLSKLKTRNGGNGQLHPDNLEKFLRTFHVKREWWDNSEGEMFEEEHHEKTITMPINVWNRLERNFDNFEKNSETFEKVSTENANLIQIITNLTSNGVQSHKMK